MSLLLLARLAQAADTTALALSPATPPASDVFVEWTKVGTAPTGRGSPFRSAAAVWCKRDQGCQLRDSAGHSAALGLTGSATTITFAPRSTASYEAFGVRSSGWALVLSLTGKEWNDDWFQSLAGNDNEWR